MRRFACLLLACMTPVQAELSDYVEFDDPRLMAGRAIWLENCEGCHGYGIADAPIPMRPQEWEFRLAKGRAVLYAHAINGFFGPDDSMMPARGGNPALTDEEVKVAVDYVAALAKFYIDNRGE